MYSSLLMGAIGVTMAIGGMTISKPSTWVLFILICLYGAAKRFNK